MDQPLSSEMDSESRWADEEWRTFELYEKKRIRDRRKRIFFVSAAMLLFLLIAGIPVVKDRSPKWETLRIARDLSVEVEKLKTLAIKEKAAIRMTFLSGGLLRVDRGTNCSSTGFDQSTVVVTKRWTERDQDFKILTPEEALVKQVGFVDSQVCFDPVVGLGQLVRADGAQQVIMIVPQRDFDQDRLDRASYVVIQGASALVTLN